MDTRRTSAPHVGGAPRRARRRDAGSASVEMVIATPLLMLLVLLIVQAGIWAHATHCAQSAATRAAQAAARYEASAGDGERTGTDTIEALAPSIIDQPHVVVDRSTALATVTVTGTATTLVPGLTWNVRATATAPVERFIPDTGSPP